jgi:hypothetical protein
VTWWCRLTALLLLVGIVLSPLRAAATMIPTLIAYDAVIGPTAMMVLGRFHAVRPKAEQPCINAYDSAILGYDTPYLTRVSPF